MPLPLCSTASGFSAYFTNLETQVAALGAIGGTASSGQIAAALAELQTLTTKVYGDISTLYSTVSGQATLMALITPLLSAPTGSFPSILGWINSFITYLEQVYLPNITLATQLTAITTNVTSLTSAINAAAAALSGSVTIPSVSVVCNLNT